MYASICRESALRFPAPKSATFNNLYKIEDCTNSFVELVLGMRIK